MKNKNYHLNNQAGSEKSSVKSSVKSSDKILDLIIQNKRITMLEIAQLIGVSKRAVEKQVAKLKDEGFLKRVGGRKDGYWEINDRRR